ncbi:MAG: NAD(P)H-binding protein, partial [Opitutae bacterium]|nr:NAD(P)H-binding protein [Opitutae bacterium]
SGLDYVILQPGRLQDDRGTGLIEVAEDLGRHGTMPREDVADAIIECLRNYLTIGKTIQMISGELKIKDAIAQFAGGGNLPPIA